MEAVALIQCDLSEPGITRRRYGRGFSYSGPDGKKITDAALIDHLKSLAIPPAWTNVWICTDPRGHIQATGDDDAGRTQYIYHPQWRIHQDEVKFNRTLEVGDALPTARARVTRLLRREDGDRDKILAIAFRLLDLGAIRVGNEAYALQNGSYGLTTMLIKHVQCDGSTVRLCFPAKSGQTVDTEITNKNLVEALQPLLDRPRTQPVLAWRQGSDWHPLTSGMVNDFLREVTGVEMTAKDFRTWHGTVLAATRLAAVGVPSSAGRRKRAVAAVMREVAELLGNTPTVARNSYVDPRVVDLYHDGVTACIPRRSSRAAVERAVLDLLGDE